MTPLGHLSMNSNMLYHFQWICVLTQRKYPGFGLKTNVITSRLIYHFKSYSQFLAVTWWRALSFIIRNTNFNNKIVLLFLQVPGLNCKCVTGFLVCFLFFTEENKMWDSLGGKKYDDSYILSVCNDWSSEALDFWNWEF